MISFLAKISQIHTIIVVNVFKHQQLSMQKQKFHILTLIQINVKKSIEDQCQISGKHGNLGLELIATNSYFTQYSGNSLKLFHNLCENIAQELNNTGEKNY